MTKPASRTCSNVRFGQGFPCPSCERPSRWSRIKAERAYSCQWCGHHLHPTVGTPFEQTRTSLQLWFYAIHLFTTTRHGVSGKELQRQLGVTYKTAWRMGHAIREHMADVDGEAVIGGPGTVVEVDETLVGGYRKGKRGRQLDGRAYVLGMVERGGDIVTKVVPSIRSEALLPHVAENVLPGTEIHTDMLRSYQPLGGSGYVHKSVAHNDGVYVDRLSGAHTQGIEGFWRHLKLSIAGTHISVSTKHLERYTKEFEYRFNRRKDGASMLPELLSVFGPLKR